MYRYAHVYINANNNTLLYIQHVCIIQVQVLTYIHVDALNWFWQWLSDSERCSRAVSLLSFPFFFFCSGRVPGCYCIERRAGMEQDKEHIAKESINILVSDGIIIFSLFC